jgi:hypothetical protein
MTGAIILTAASQAYWRCLYQLLRDIERRRLHTAHRVIAHDLGLDADTLARLTRWFGWCQFRRFRFEEHPSHVAVAAGTYAWKPLIVDEVVREAQGPVLWLDSATLMRTGDLSPVLADIHRCGVYAVHGQASLGERCDPLVLAALDVPPATRLRPEIVAGVIGLDAANPAVRALAAEWAMHARIERHIQPRVPPLKTHKWEQSLLGILLYRAADAGQIRLPGGEIDISSGRPIRWMSSRNLVAPDKLLWADPWVRWRYRAYKIADQALWRLKTFRDRRVHGAHRKLKEHFSV